MAYNKVKSLHSLCSCGRRENATPLAKALYLQVLMRKISFVILCLIFVVVGSYATAKIFIPPSIEVYFAGISGCDINEESLSKNEPNFQRIKWWERLLTHIYRFEQKNLKNEFVITDSLTEDSSVYHIMLLASDNTASYCDSEITSLIREYRKLGVPIDLLNADGLTALHEAVIMKNQPIIQVLVESGANIDLKNSKIESPISGMSAIEIANFFLTRKPDDKEIKSIIKLLENEI